MQNYPFQIPSGITILPDVSGSQWIVNKRAGISPETWTSGLSVGYAFVDSYLGVEQIIR